MVNIYIILAVIPILVCSNNHQTSSLEDIPVVTATGPLPQITTSDDVVEGTTDDGIAITTETPETTTTSEEIVSSSAVTGAVRCVREEALIWINNVEFSLTLSNIAHSHLGSGTDTAVDLVKTYPGLSDHCASCFGDNVSCGTRNCWMYCTFSSFSAACLDCTNKNCNPALKNCLGVEDAEMPPVPTEDMETTTSTSTFAPRKRAVRRTTAEPSSEGSIQTVSSLPTIQAIREDTFLNTLPESIAKHWYVYAGVLVGLIALMISRNSG